MEGKDDDQVTNAAEVGNSSVNPMEKNAVSDDVDSASNPAVSEKSTPSPSSDSALRSDDDDEYETIDEESENSLGSDEINNENVPGTSGQEKPIYFYFRMRSINIIEKGMKNGLKDGYYKCHVCDKPYQQKFSLKRHFVRNHIDPKYLSPADLHNCKITKGSGKVNSEEGDGKSGAGRKRYKDDHALFVDDNKTKVLKGLYRCNVCHGVRFDLEADLKKHYSQHLTVKQTVFPCNECGDVFNSKLSLSKHAFSHNQFFKCKRCNVDFDEKSEFVAHMSTHGSGKQCKYCGKMFSTSANRKRHENIHEGGQGFTCKHCLAIFSDTKDLDMHVKKKHSKNPLICQLCPKTENSEAFSSQAQLSAHIKSVHPGAPSEAPSKTKDQPKTKSLAKPGPSTSSLTSQAASPPKAICPLCKRAFRDIRAMLTHKRLAHKKKGLHAPVPRKKKSPIRKPSPQKEADDEEWEDESSSEKAEEEEDQPQGKTKKKVLVKRRSYKRKAKQPVKSKVMRRKIAMTKKELALKEKQEESNFYSNLAQNIANNLLHHLDGKASQLTIKSYTFNDDESVEQRANRFNIPWSAYNFPKDFDVDKALEKRGKEIKARTPEEQCLFATGLRKVDPPLTEKTSSSQKNLEVNNKLLPGEEDPKDETHLKNAELNKVDIQPEVVSEKPTELKTRENPNRQDFELNHQLKRSMPVNQLRKLTPLTLEDKLKMIDHEVQSVVICTVCQERFPSEVHFEDHCINNHPNIDVSCLEIESDKKDSSPDIPLDLSRPLCPNSSTGALFSYSVPLTQPSSWTCTKCKSVFFSADDLHVHIVSCGGELFRSQYQKKPKKLKRIKHTMKHRIDLSVRQIISPEEGPNDLSKKKKRMNKERLIFKTGSVTKASLKCDKDYFSTNNSKTAKTSVASVAPNCFYCKIYFSTKLDLQEHYAMCPNFKSKKKSKNSAKVMHVVTEQKFAEKQLTMRISAIHPNNHVRKIDSRNGVASKKNPISTVVTKKGTAGAKTVSIKTVPTNQNSLNSVMDLSVKSSSSVATPPATPPQLVNPKVSSNATPLDTLRQMCQKLKNVSSSKGTPQPLVNPEKTIKVNGKAQPNVENVTVSEPLQPPLPLLNIKEVVKEIKRKASSPNPKKSSSKSILTCLQAAAKLPKSSPVTSSSKSQLSSSAPVNLSLSAKSPSNEDHDGSRRKCKNPFLISNGKYFRPLTSSSPSVKADAKDNSNEVINGVDQQSELADSNEKNFPTRPVSGNKDGAIPLSPELLVLKKKLSAKEKEVEKPIVPKEKDNVKSLCVLPGSLVKGDSVKQKDPSKLPVTEEDIKLKEKDLSTSLVSSENCSIKPADSSKSPVSKERSKKEKVSSMSLVSSENCSIKSANSSQSPVSKEKSKKEKVSSMSLVSSENCSIKPADLSKSPVSKEKSKKEKVSSMSLAVKNGDVVKKVLPESPVLSNSVKLTDKSGLPSSKEKIIAKETGLSESLVLNDCSKPKDLNDGGKPKDFPKSPVLKEKASTKEKGLSKSPNEKVIKQKDLSKSPVSKEKCNDNQNKSSKSPLPKENTVTNQNHVTKLSVPEEKSVKETHLTKSTDQVNSDGIPNKSESVDAVPEVTDVPSSKISSEEIPDLTKSVEMKDDENKVSKDDIVECSPVPNPVVSTTLERPGELMFLTGEGPKNYSDASGRESPTLENLVSSVTQNIEGFDDQDDVLPSPFLPSNNGSSTAREPSNGSLNFQIIIPRNENQSGSLLTGIGIPSDSLNTFPIIESSIQKSSIPLEPKLSPALDMPNQKASSKFQDVDGSLKISPPLPSSSIQKQSNQTIKDKGTHQSPKGKDQKMSDVDSVLSQTFPLHSIPRLSNPPFSDKRNNQRKPTDSDVSPAFSPTFSLCSVPKTSQTSKDKSTIQNHKDKGNEQKKLPGSEVSSATLPSGLQDASAQDPKSPPPSNAATSGKNSTSTSNKPAEDNSAGLETSNSPSSTVDNVLSKKYSPSLKRKTDDSGFPNKVIIRKNDKHSPTKVAQPDSSQRGDDTDDEPGDQSGRSAQLRAFRVKKSTSVEKSSSQEESDFAKKMKEKFRKSFGSGSTSTLAAISLAASEANRAQPSPTTPSNDASDANAELPDSTVKEESGPNEEDGAKGSKEFEKHTCPYCFLDFAYLTNFRRHLRICRSQPTRSTDYQVPSSSTGVTRLQHLPKKDEVEGSMLHLLRHQSRQSQMIKEFNNKVPEVTTSTPALDSSEKKITAYVCEDCKKIYLSLFKLMQHRLKDHKFSSDAREAMLSARQQALEAGVEDIFDWDDPMCPEANDSEMEADIFPDANTDYTDCQEGLPEEKLELPQDESMEDPQEDNMKADKAEEHLESEINPDPADSPKHEKEIGEDSLDLETNTAESILPEVPEVITEDSVASEDNSSKEKPSKEKKEVIPNRYKELLDPSFLVLPSFGKGRGRKKKEAPPPDPIEVKESKESNIVPDADVKESETSDIVPKSKKTKGQLKGRSKAQITALKMTAKKVLKKLGPKRRGPKGTKAASRLLRGPTLAQPVQTDVPTKGRRGRKPKEAKKLEDVVTKASEHSMSKRNDVPIKEDVIEKDHVLTVMKNVPSQSASTSRRGKKIIQKTIPTLDIPKGKKVQFNDDELSAFASPPIDSHGTVSFRSDLSIVKEKTNPPKTLANSNAGSVKVIKLKSDTIPSDLGPTTKASNAKGNRPRRSTSNDSAGTGKSAKQPAFLIDYFKIESSPPTSPTNSRMQNFKVIKAIPQSICDIQSVGSSAARQPSNVRMVRVLTDKDSDADDSPDSKPEAQRKRVCPICKKKFSGTLQRNRHVQLAHPRKNNRGNVEVVLEDEPVQEEKQPESSKGGRSAQRQCNKPLSPPKRKYQKTPQNTDSKRRRL